MLFKSIKKREYLLKFPKHFYPQNLLLFFPRRKMPTTSQKQSLVVPLEIRCLLFVHAGDTLDYAL